MTQNTFLNTGSSSSSSSTFSFGASSSSSSSSSSSTSGDRESKRGPITDMSKLQRSQLQAELDKELTSEETSKAAHNERYARIRALAEAKRSQEAASASSSAASPSPLSPAAASGRSRASTGRYVTLQGAQGGVGSSQSGNTLSPAEGSSLPRRASAPNALSNPVVPSIFRRERASPERYVDVTWQGGVESPQSASALSPAAGSSQPRRGSAPNTLSSSVAPSLFRRERASPERYMG
ncbi:MAG TPA: hypothetical protein VLG76_02475, partial [Rhabdochlamydiaceae bacterium]|nr:hypothetical protein [Rhabdochlamydiaceae bacterium]